MKRDTLIFYSIAHWIFLRQFSCRGLWKAFWNSDVIYKKFINKLYVATDFAVNSCCSSCGLWTWLTVTLTVYMKLYSRGFSLHLSCRFMQQTFPLWEQQCSSSADCATSVVSVNTRLAATAAEVRVTAVAACSDMLILQRGPCPQHTM